MVSATPTDPDLASVDEGAAGAPFRRLRVRRDDHLAAAHALLFSSAARLKGSVKAASVLAARAVRRLAR